MTKELQLNVDVANDLSDANLFITSKNHYRRKPQKVKDAESANLPIYVLRSNTPSQIRQFLNTLYPTVEKSKTDLLKFALHEAEEAIEQIRDGQPAVELNPQSAYIRRLQHLIAERNDLSSKSTGKEPQRRVKIFKG